MRAHVHAQMCSRAKPKETLGRSILRLSCPGESVSTCCFLPVSGPGLVAVVGGKGEGGVFHFPSHITSAAADLQVSTSGVFGGEQRTNDLVKVKLLSEPLRTQRHV